MIIKGHALISNTPYVSLDGNYLIQNKGRFETYFKRTNSNQETFIVFLVQVRMISYTSYSISYIFEQYIHIWTKCIIYE